MDQSAPAPVAIIMGSRSDWPTLSAAAEALDALGVAYTAKVVSAHRTPERMFAFAKSAKANGVKLIIAGAGGAAHLPGMTASLTELPVIGVPVATMAVGRAGAKNAGLYAAQILALSDAALAQRVAAYRQAQTDSVPDSVEDVSVKDASA